MPHNAKVFHIAIRILLRRTFFQLQQILTDSYPIFREWSESLFLRLYQYSVCGCGCEYKVKWKRIPPLVTLPFLFSILSFYTVHRMARKRRILMRFCSENITFIPERKCPLGVFWTPNSQVNCLLFDL